jgi:hypothetical protein
MTLLAAVEQCIAGLREASTDANASKRGLTSAARLSQSRYDFDPELAAIVSRIRMAAEYERPEDLKFEALDASRRLEAWHKTQLAGATEALTKIDLTTFSYDLSELFSAFDHLLRASDPNASREYHIEWTRYHWRRFRNAFGSRPEAEMGMWREMSARIAALEP